MQVTGTYKVVDIADAKIVCRYLRTGLFMLFMLFAFNTPVFASADSPTSNTDIQKPADIVDAEQQRIDLFDGTEDGRVDLGDSVINAYAQKVYFKLVDTIQAHIEA